MTARIRIRRATAANWASDNPVLDHGEMGLIFNTASPVQCVGYKIGNGVTVFASLPLFKPPYEGSEDAGVNISWEDIALLSDDNVFSGATNTFNPGDVTVTAGDISIPGYDVTEDENVLKGGSGTKGCLFMSVNGPCLANGNLLGKAKDVSDTNFGPFVIVNEDKVVVGGTNEASGAAGDRTTLEYDQQPDNATDITTLGDKVVPTKKLVVDHVAATIPKSGMVYFTTDGANPHMFADSGGANGTGQSANEGWVMPTGSATTTTITNAANWGSKYLLISFNIGVYTDGGNWTAWYLDLHNSGDASMITTPTWHGGVRDDTGTGVRTQSTTHIVTTTALESDGVLKILGTGNYAATAYIASFQWWASDTAIDFVGVTAPD